MNIISAETIDFIKRKEEFIEGLRRESLAAGAIPNPHGLVPLPRIKKLALIVNVMLQRGLPHGWGK